MVFSFRSSLKRGLEPGQIVRPQAVQHLAVLEPGLDVCVELRGLERKLLLEGHHRPDDPVTEPHKSLVAGVDPPLQPLAHVLLPVVAGLDRQLVRAERFVAQVGQPLESGLECGQVLAVEHRQSLRAHRLRVASALLGLRAAVPVRLQRLLGGRQDLARLRELGVQLPEKVGSRFEAAPFIVEPGDLGRERRPVELAEISVLGELRQGVEPFAHASLLLLHCDDATPEVAEPCLEPARVGFQGGDLGRVGPAEHVAAAVVDAVAVVLLVALARRLDLAGPGDGAGLAPELLSRRAARDVEAAGELLLQPLVELRIRLDGELPHQGVAMELREFTPRRSADPEVDEPAPEVLRIHPPGHPRIALVGYEQRKAEVAEQPFRRSLPVALLLPHLEQLARERHVRFVQVERPAERGPHGDLLRRDVAAAGLEALDLAGEGIVLLLPLPQVHTQLGQVVLKAGLVRSKLLGLVREACPLVEKGRVVRRRGFVHPAGELRVALGLAFARFAFAFEPLNLPGQAFEAVAAVLGDGTPQLLHVAALAVPALRGALDLRALARPVVGEPRDACIQQVSLQPREERPEGPPGTGGAPRPRRPVRHVVRSRSRAGRGARSGASPGAPPRGRG